MKKTFAFCLCLFLLLPTGCARTEKVRYQAQFLSLFDTVTTIVGYADSKESFSELSEQIRSDLEEYHKLYTAYDDYEGINNIKTINDNAGKMPVVVDTRILSLLQFAKEEYTATDGAVNIAFGAVLKLWHDYREAGTEDPENAETPPMELLREAAKHCDMNDVIIDPAASTVYLRDPLMRLDVGAIAKGYAVEQVITHLQNKGVRSLLLSVGGNVRAIGGKLSDKNGRVIDWEIAIQNPDKSGGNNELMSVRISDFSVVSSGIYERYYTVDGVPYHHIIDPATLFPSDSFAQVTIICRDSGMADALSTAVFNMPLENGLRYIESLQDTEAMWVMKDGSIKYSDGFYAYMK